MFIRYTSLYTFATGQPTKCSVLLSHTELRICDDENAKNLEMLDMKKPKGAMYLIKIPMFNASNHTKTKNGGLLLTRLCKIITVQSSAPNIKVDLVFDALSEEKQFDIWNGCIDKAKYLSMNPLTPLMLAKRKLSGHFLAEAKSWNGSRQLPSKGTGTDPELLYITQRKFKYF